MMEGSSEPEGLLLIDKPPGPTSHDVVAALRRITGIRRIGHTGTLDPLASGLLILCVGRAARLAEYVTGLPKSYQASIRFGQETDSYDSEGVLTAERPVEFSRDQLASALESFRGEISQRPPRFSAVKINGTPVYKLAREGVQVAVPERTVTIYELEIIKWQRPDLQLFINCSAGTYIRALARDLGELLKCGGHITNLRRTGVGEFPSGDSIALSELNEENWLSYLQPSDLAVNHLGKIVFSEEDSISLLNGRTTDILPNHTQNSPARAYDTAGRFVGIVERRDGCWCGKKIFYQKPVHH